MTFNTGNPIGSTDSRDRLDNTENMDYLENSTTELTHADRLGTVRKTRHGMEVEHDAQIAAHETEHDAQIAAHETEHDAQIAAHETEHDAQIAAHETEHDAQMQSFENDFDGRLAGMAFTRVGTFTSGYTLTDMRQTLLWEVSQGGDGHEYGWSGSFPQLVQPGSSPSPISAGSWVDRTDDTLRGEFNFIQKKFASVADMIADTTLVVGQFVETFSYYQDGLFSTLETPIGGNTYIIVAAGTGVADSGSFINLSNGLQAKALFPNGINLDQFGAKRVYFELGTPLNALFDNGVPLQNALNYCTHRLNNIHEYNGGVVLDISSGEYHFDTRASAHVSPLPNTNKAEVTLTIRGAGAGNTVLVANADNSNGIIQLLIDRNIEMVNVEGLTLLSDLDQSVAETRNNGIGLEIYNNLFGQSGYGDKANWSCTVKDVRVGGYGLTHAATYTRGNWVKGIHIFGMWHPVLKDIHTKARINVTELTVPRHTDACTHAIHINECYSPEMTNIYVQGRWQHGLWVEGGTFEDFRMVNIFSVAPEYAVGISHPSAPVGALTEPGGAIIGLHANGGRRSLSIISHRQITVDDFYIYAASRSDADEYGELLPCGIYLYQASDLRLYGAFYEPGFYTSDTNASVGILIEGRSEAITADVQFGHGGIGVVNNSTEVNRKTILIKSSMPSSRRLSGVWAPLTTLVDNAGTATLVEHNFGDSQDRFSFLSGKYSSATYASAMRVGALHPDQAYAGAYEFSSLNAAGKGILLSLIRSHMPTRTAGLEKGIVDFFTLLDGNMVNPLRLIPPQTNNETAAVILTRVSGTLVAKTVVMGAADSGGAGYRLLRVAN